MISCADSATVLSCPFFFVAFDWFGIIGLSVDRLLALFWNGVDDINGVDVVIWFIGTLLGAFNWPKPLKKLLFDKFNDVDCAAGMFDDITVVGLLNANCVGKLGDGAIDVVCNVDVKFLKQRNFYKKNDCQEMKNDTYFICGAGFAVAIDGILIEDGIKTLFTFFSGCAAELSSFKQDDLKSFKLNSGNDCEAEPSIDLKN